MADGSIHIDTKIDSSGLEKQLDDLKGSLESMGKTLSVAVTAPLVAMGAFATKAFADAEKGDARLRASLEMTGQNVEAMFQKYQQLGSAIQEVTDIDDDAVKSLATFGTQLGITSDQMESAIKGAIGLSKITGADLQQSMKMVAMAAQGEFAMLERLSPEMRAAKTDAEKLAIAQKLMANGYKLATAEGKTFGGLVSMIKNDIGDLGEQFGQIIAEALLPFARWLRDTVKGFQSLSPETKKIIVVIASLAAAIGPTLLIVGQLSSSISAIITLYSSLGVVMKSVRAAAISMNTAMMSNPFIAIAASIAIATAALWKLNKEYKEYLRKQKQAFEQARSWSNGLNELNEKDLKNRRKVVTDLIKLNEGYISKLRAQGKTEGYMDGFKQSVGNSEETIAKLKRSLFDIDQQLIKIKKSSKDSGSTLGSSFGGGSESIEDTAEDVEELDYRLDSLAFQTGLAIQTMNNAGAGLALGNLWQAFKDQFADADQTMFMLGLGINEEIAKGISAGMYIATSAVKGLVENMAAAFQKTMEIFSGVFSILSWMADFSPTDMYNAFKSFIDGVADFILNDLGSLSIFFRDSFDLVGGLVSSIMANLPVLLETLGNVITYMVDYFVQNGPRLISQIVEIIGKVFIVLVEAFPDIFRAAFVGIMAAIDKLIDIAPALIDAIFTAISEVIVYIGKNAQALTKALTALFIVAVLGIIDNMPQIIAALVEAFPYIVMAFSVDLPIALVKASPQIVRALVLALGSILYRVPIALGRALRDIGGDIIKGIEKGMTEAIPRMWSNIKRAFDRFIDSVKSFFGIASPSKLFFGFGVDIIQGMINGIMSMLGDLVNVFSFAYDWGADVMKSFISGLSSMISDIANVGSQIGSALFEAIKNAIGTIDIGGLISGGASSGGSIIDTITGALPKIKKPKIKKPKIKIPGFADGTNNAPGGLSLVGEEGPELVNLARGSQVIPAGITSGLLSGVLGGITLNNVMTGILTVDGREIGRVAFQNIDRFAMGAYGIKR